MNSKHANDCEMGKRIKVVLLLSGALALAIIALIVIVGFALLSGDLDSFISELIFSVTLIWSATILIIPKCFQNPSAEKMQ